MREKEREKESKLGLSLLFHAPNSRYKDSCIIWILLHSYCSLISMMTKAPFICTKLLLLISLTDLSVYKVQISMIAISYPWIYILTPISLLIDKNADNHEGHTLLHAISLYPTLAILKVAYCFICSFIQVFGYQPITWQPYNAGKSHAKTGQEFQLKFTSKFRKSSTVQFGWISAHHILRFLFLADRSGTWCDLLLL